MFGGTKRAGMLLGLALALLMGTAALAAPENEKGEVRQHQAPDDNQAPEDNKAYLPPWMQKPAAATASAPEKGTEAGALDASTDPAAKQKQAGQKTPRRRRDGIFGSGFSFFWR
jgi:hypothetical protein